MTHKVHAVSKLRVLKNVLHDLILTAAVTELPCDYIKNTKRSSHESVENEMMSATFSREGVYEGVTGRTDR